MNNIEWLESGWRNGPVNTHKVAEAVTEWPPADWQPLIVNKTIMAPWGKPIIIPVKTYPDWDRLQQQHADQKAKANHDNQTAGIQSGDC